MNKASDFAMFTRSEAKAHEDDSIDLRAITKLLWGGKWIIAICALFGLTVGLFLASQIEPRYRATAKLLLGTERADVLRNEGVMVEEYFGTTTLLTHIEILSSTKLINRVIDELRLLQDRLPPFPFRHVERALSAEYDEPIEAKAVTTCSKRTANSAQAPMMASSNISLSRLFARRLYRHLSFC